MDISSISLAEVLLNHPAPPLPPGAQAGVLAPVVASSAPTVANTGTDTPVSVPVSNTALFIGVGMAVLVLIGIGFFFLSKKKIS